jgi:hypothetical protein
MQPKVIIKVEFAIYGLRGDGANASALWEKFEKRDYSDYSLYIVK